jgi:biopolymer transport protein ExbD/biopolymer transport protein TolR
MAITASEQEDAPVVPQMNVTPLVDVVLVLLIIFMVITPLLAKTFWIHTPMQQQEEVTAPESEATQPLVLQVGPDRALQINGSAVTYDELPERLRRIFAARSDHVLFFDADDHAPYGFVVQVMDQAREGGAVTIAALTEHLGPQGAATIDTTTFLTNR